MSILEVHDVSIRYMTGDFKDIGLKEYVMRKLKGEYHVNEFWADRNISFSLEKGDMLGIIGTNGAGKSTLLKAISGIMEPTEGWVHREGNIAALLELASGFDGDLTVRENTYLRGAMLGYTRKFMDEMYDKIIAFAELQDFQDRPFKQLSSGMKSRLAFSIASLVQPDILILDEVLSVGDGAFRKKSEAKMREIIQSGATTILVSHSIQQVRSMCNKILWLHRGEQIVFGNNVEGICDLYQKFLNKEIQIESVKENLPASIDRKSMGREKKREMDTMPHEEKHMETPNKIQDQEIDTEKMSEEQAEPAENMWHGFELTKSVSKPLRTAFLGALITGVITHLYIFTNLLLNHDSVWRLFYDNDNLGLGRWALKAASAFSTNFQLPVVIGVISILMLALTAGITVEFLNISDKPTAILTAAFIVTMPSVACIFSYMFTADAYFIALFLTAMAAYITKKYRFGWLPGIVICAVACGIYQAFICYAIGLLLIDCILRLFTDEPIQNIVKSGIKYIFVIIGSLLLYYGILKVLLAVKSVELLSYQGFSSISLLNLKGFLAQIPLAYKNFLKYFIKSAYSTKLYQIAQIFFLALGCIAALLLIVYNKLYKDTGRIALLFLGALLLPLALNFITILAADAQVHALMIYSFVLMDVFILRLTEIAVHRILEDKKDYGGALYLGTVFLAGLLVWNNFCISNIAYLRLQVSYENSYALANRIVARIEVLEDYSPDIPVAVMGETSGKLYGGTVRNFSQINSLTGIDGKLLYSTEPHIRTRTFIEHYIGLHMPRPNNEQKQLLTDSETIAMMPSYPAEGSITFYEGVIVVKLSDGEIR